MFVLAVLLVMPENPNKTTTAGRPTCVTNHINISTDDMCYGRYLGTKFVKCMYLRLWGYGAVMVQTIGRSALIQSRHSPTRVESCRRGEKSEKAGWTDLPIELH